MSNEEKKIDVEIDQGITIGDNNKIKKSVIGNNSTPTKTEKSLSKIFWQIVVPIIVGVAVTAICVWLGLKGALGIAGCATQTALCKTSALVQNIQ